MDKNEENFREFNARIFVKGKCYTFDQIYSYEEPVNDKIITSIIWHTYNYIKTFFAKFFNILIPFKIFSSDKTKKKAFNIFIGTISLFILALFIWLLLFKIKK